MEMYLAGVSVRRVEDITEALWGTRVSPSTVSRLNQKIYERIEAWRNQPIAGEHPYVYTRRHRDEADWAGEVRNVSLLVAIAVNDRRLPRDSRHLRGRQGGQVGLELLPQTPEGPWPQRRAADRIGCLQGIGGIGGRVLHRGALAALHRALVPQRIQPRTVHEGARSGGDAKAIHAAEDIDAAKAKAALVVWTSSASQRLGGRRKLSSNTVDETLAYYAFPEEHWRRIRTNNPLERLMREIRRRTRVVGAFPDGQSCLNLAAARLRHIAGTNLVEPNAIWGWKFSCNATQN